MNERILTAGVLFTVNDSDALVSSDDIKAMLSHALCRKAQRVNIKQFDITKEGNFSVQTDNSLVCISNIDFFTDIVAHPNADIASLYKAFGQPEHMLFYVYMNIYGCYGFSWVENGERKRTKYQYYNHEDTLVIEEKGEVTATETHWLNAPFSISESDTDIFGREYPAEKVYYIDDYTESPESHLTGAITKTLIEEKFNFVPWEDGELDNSWDFVC